MNMIGWFRTRYLGRNMRAQCAIPRSLHTSDILFVFILQKNDDSAAPTNLLANAPHAGVLNGQEMTLPAPTPPSGPCLHLPPYQHIWSCCTGTLHWWRMRATDANANPFPTLTLDPIVWQVSVKQGWVTRGTVRRLQAAIQELGTLHQIATAISIPLSDPAQEASNLLTKLSAAEDMDEFLDEF